MNATSMRRRIGGTVAAIAVATTLAACAAGQIAETANVKPSLDGTFGQVGAIKLEGVAIHTPSVSGRASGKQYYVKGNSTAMRISLVNTGQRPDTLTDVSSPAFGGWDVVPTASVSSTATAKVSGAATSVRVAPQTSVPLGLEDLGYTNPKTHADTSARTLVLTGLRKGRLYPGEEVPVTFTFASAGALTLTVPVQLGDNGPRETIPAEPTPTAG